MWVFTVRFFQLYFVFEKFHNKMLGKTLYLGFHPTQSSPFPPRSSILQLSTPGHNITNKHWKGLWCGRKKADSENFRLEEGRVVNSVVFPSPPTSLSQPVVGASKPEPATDADKKSREKRLFVEKTGKRVT